MVEVYVAGVAFVAGAGDADEGFFEVLVGEAECMEHGLCGGLGGVLGDVFAVFVEFHR